MMDKATMLKQAALINLSIQTLRTGKSNAGRVGNKFIAQDDWQVTIHYLDRASQDHMFTCAFHMGEGHNGRPPNLFDVLYSLGADSSFFRYGGTNFEDWASESGYDTDSRTAERTFHQVQEESARFIAFMEYVNQSFTAWLTPLPELPFKTVWAWLDDIDR